MDSPRHFNLPSRLGLILAAALSSGLLVACGSGYNSYNSKQHQMTPVNSRGLWIANGTNVLEYLPNQLAGGTSAAVAHLTNNSGAFGAPQGLTFDAAGNLWIMDPAGMIDGVATPALFEFTEAQLAALSTNPTPDPIATITSTALSFPQQSIFDAQGNQWVTDHNNNTVLVFTAAQLAQSGSHSFTPAVTITSADFNGPLGIAFDMNGDLWVANNGGVPGANGAMSPAGTTLVKFLAAHLPVPPSSGMLTPDLLPDVVLSDDGANSIQAPWALSFDAMGDLWSSNANPPFTLVKFVASSLAMTGAPVPAVTIEPTMLGGNATLDAPNGICLDNIGDLAAMNSGGAFGIAFLSKNQLTTGATTPDAFIVGAATMLNAPAGCNFGPLVN